ncbi:ferric reductase-like transmembrane domain-containing protein [Cohnella fermenti]|uniref:Ferric reductase n=1 Tax=Cohnella fermenti TaxID=2565925 RepID=A0A4S4BXI5_9BACL|nr:ferric reductase-like transmembrane domain-containing protein [Cohnella fermenti]THF79903.1 ferric reductase [Cohnella fermenti]
MQPLYETFNVWTTTRAAGLTAYVLLFVSTAAGLLMSGKLSGRKSQAIILAVHQWAGWFGFLFGAMHGAVLLFDDYVGYSAAELLIPFAASDHRWLTGLGTLSLYVSVVLIASSDAMKKLGRKLWRTIHFLAFAGYGMALLHGALLGTDAGSNAIGGMYAVTGMTVAALLAYRIYSARLASSAKAAARRQAPAGSREFAQKPPKMGY